MAEKSRFIRLECACLETWPLYEHSRHRPRTLLHIPRYRKYRASADIYADVARIFPTAWLPTVAPAGEKTIGVAATTMLLLRERAKIPRSQGAAKKGRGEKNKGNELYKRKKKKKKKEKEGGEEIKNWIKHRWKAIPEGHGYQRRWFVGGHPISVPCQRNSMGVKRRCSYVRDYKRRPVSIP